MARKRGPVPLRDPSKQTLYNSIGLSLTNSICTLAFGIVLTTCVYIVVVALPKPLRISVYPHITFLTKASPTAHLAV